jgi:hypothetical protein
MSARFTPRVLLYILLLAQPALAGDASRPVDTLQFGLLSRGMSTGEVYARLGPPAHTRHDTRSALVPFPGRVAHTRRKRDAPAYVVVTTDYEWWYYPAGGGSMATVLEFRDGELYAKDKYR